MKIREVLAVGIAFLAINACGDVADSVGIAPKLESPTEPVASLSLSSETGTAHHRPLPWFTVTAQASGDFRPGGAVTIGFEVVTSFDTESADIWVIAPELEAAKWSGWGDDFRTPTGRTLQPAAAWRQSMAAGETIRKEITLSFLAAGYYRVVISAQRRSEGPSHLGGTPLQTVSHETLWLYIDQVRGRATGFFDAEILPTHAVRAPGPIRFRSTVPLSVRQAERGVRQEASILSGFSTWLRSAWHSSLRRPRAFPRDRRTGLVNWTLKYYSADDTAYVPISRANYFVDFFERDEESETEPGPRTGGIAGATADNGLISFNCRPDELYFGYAELSNFYAEMDPISVMLIEGDFDLDCDEEFDATAQSEASHVFLGVTEAAENTNDIFGQARSQVEVKLGDFSTSSYDDEGDRIKIDSSATPSHIWGDYGAYVVGHEYGHAFHEKGLGGLPDPFSCGPGGHGLGMETNLGCAFSEGFAYFVGTITRPAYTGQKALNNETNFWFDPQEDGSIVEGVVAAFFHDLLDPANEPHDSLELEGSYLAEIIETCEVETNSNWARANGIDHLIFCMENQVDTLVTGSATYFPTRSTDPDDQRESVTEPGSWTMSKIRAIWKKNLYGEGG